MSNQEIEVVLEALVEELSPFLQERGFKRRGKKTFFNVMNECVQEMNIQFRRVKGEEAGYVEACPNITFIDLEKMAARLKGENYKKGWPTAAANIGNLQPQKEFIEWPLTLATNTSSLAETIKGYIVRNAEPFWKCYSTLETLIKGYEEGDTRLTLNGHGHKWRLAVAYCLLQEYEKAISALQEWTVGRPPNSVLEQAIYKIKKLKMEVN